jgi:NAD(P)-dependent dehydrogenase (short-subunit alcohol dehydrogenase family)
LLASKGCAIAAAYNSSDARVKQLVDTINTQFNVPVQAFQADLSDYHGPAKLYAEVKAAMGEPDILFANHGVAKVIDNIHQVDLETLETTWRINFATSFEVGPPPLLSSLSPPPPPLYSFLPFWKKGLGLHPLTTVRINMLLSSPSWRYPLWKEKAGAGSSSSQAS